MSKTTTYVGILAAALLVVSAGTAAAEGTEDPSTSGIDTSSISGSMGAETDTETEEGTDDDSEEGPLGSVGEMAPASVTGSLPGYATGPLGSTATLACNLGSVAGAAGGLTGVPVSMVCMVLKPVAESGDSLLNGDVDGSVSAMIGGVPLVGGSLKDQVDTASVTDSVEGSIGEERLGSLSESSLSPEETTPAN